MLKQVEYDFRLLKVSAVDPGATRQELDKIVNTYLQGGWEILNVQTVEASGNEAFNAYHFVRYEEVDEAKA
jgi:hypothetical protein